MSILPPDIIFSIGSPRDGLPSLDHYKGLPDKRKNPGDLRERVLQVTVSKVSSVPRHSTMRTDSMAENHDACNSWKFLGACLMKADFKILSSRSSSVN
ncbi:hypothetical protein Mapa_013486 [Marchantia paleacea]|nr:hypothetical protein Mapa_013486 [Marchantia paleacea]